MGNKNRRNSTAHTTPIRPSQITDLISAANALDIGQSTGNEVTRFGESPLAVRPVANPSGQMKPPFTPRWEQVYAEDTSEPLVINTLLLDGAKKHQLNALWEQLDSLKFTSSSEDKKYKTSVIAEAKQFFQNALDMYFLRGAGAISTLEGGEIHKRDLEDGAQGHDQPQRVRLGYFFRTHAKGFMITFRSDEELWLARDHADEWLQNLFHTACGGFGRRMAHGVARLFEVWGGVILKNVQLTESVLKEVWANRPSATSSVASPNTSMGSGTGSPSSRDRPRFDMRYCKDFERANPMYHADTKELMQYRVRRMEYLGGARRGHTISVFFHDRDATEYFFCQVGTVTVFDQIIPVIDFYRQSGTSDARWEGEGRALDVEEIRNKNVRLAKERTERKRQEMVRTRALGGIGPRRTSSVRSGRSGRSARGANSSIVSSPGGGHGLLDLQDQSFGYDDDDDEIVGNLSGLSGLNQSFNSQRSGARGFPSNHRQLLRQLNDHPQRREGSVNSFPDDDAETQAVHDDDEDDSYIFNESSILEHSTPSKHYSPTTRLGLGRHSSVGGNGNGGNREQFSPTPGAREKGYYTGGNGGGLQQQSAQYIGQQQGGMRVTPPPENMGQMMHSQQQQQSPHHAQGQRMRPRSGTAASSGYPHYSQSPQQQQQIQGQGQQGHAHRPSYSGPPPPAYYHQQQQQQQGYQSPNAMDNGQQQQQQSAQVQGQQQQQQQPTFMPGRFDYAQLERDGRESMGRAFGGGMMGGIGQAVSGSENVRNSGGNGNGAGEWNE